MSNKQTEVIRAIVRSVNERHVITYLEQDYGDISTRDSVTFTISNWEGKRPPEEGQVVELFDIMLYVRGWRAAIARPVTPHSSQKGT